MPEKNAHGSKSRILFLRNYLEEHTDEEHFVTTDELIRICEQHGYTAHRQTIADDLAVLNASGFDVVALQIARNKTKTNAYHIGVRLFELPEVKLLIDAVSASRFITREKSENLISKLTRLASMTNRSALIAGIHASERLKTTNPNIFVNIDTICNAINHHRKIAFRYWDYSPAKEKILRHGGAEYTASPYALIRDDDRYYAASYSDHRQKVIAFRVDRMCEVRELAEEAWIDPSFNEAEYARKVIKMFDDNLPEEHVTLRCRNDLMKNILDRFGEETETRPFQDEFFEAVVTVVPSSTFFGWVMQYQGGILIQQPASVKASFEQMLSDLLQKQSDLEIPENDFPV